MCVSRRWLVFSQYCGLRQSHVVPVYFCRATEKLFFSRFNSAAFPPLSVTSIYLWELFGHALDQIWASQVQPAIILPQFLTFLLPL